MPLACWAYSSLEGPPQPATTAALRRARQASARERVMRARLSHEADEFVGQLRRGGGHQPQGLARELDHGAARLCDREPPGGPVPRPQPALEVAVQPAGGD